MLAYAIRCAVSALLTILAMTLIIFVFVRIAGDPTHLMLPAEATEADREVLRQQLGLSDPYVVQYLRYLFDLVRGDFGTSYYYRLPALQVIAPTLLPSAMLAAAALALSLAVGVPLGILAALAPGGATDRLGLGFAAVGQAAPAFLVALLLIRLFAVGLGWLPTSGYGDLRHLILPTLALSLFSAAALFRLTRANLAETLAMDFVTLARLKGMPLRVIVLKHALRNAALPIVTFAASQFGILLGGGVAIETIFAWPGIGLLIVNAILGLDYIVVQAGAIVIVAMFVALNLVVDLLYGWIDPRIRYA